mgnify:CR=1
MNKLLEILKKAENDVRNNRVAPISDTFSDLRAILANKNEKSR